MVTGTVAVISEIKMVETQTAVRGSSQRGGSKTPQNLQPLRKMVTILAGVTTIVIRGGRYGTEEETA